MANEVLVKMMTWKGEIQVDDVDNLQRIATIVARRTLVDSGRRRQLRNDLQRSLNDAFPSAQYESVNGKSDQIQIALDKLGEIDPKLVRLVELICVESYGLKEASEVLEWSERTTARRWSFAKSWLANAIAD